MLFLLSAEFKYALFQHREEAKDHVVRNIGDLILKYVRNCFSIYRNNVKIYNHFWLLA